MESGSDTSMLNTRARGTGRTRQVLIAAAVVIGLGPSYALWRAGVATPAAADIARLSAALASQGFRPFDGRLSGFAYVPARAVTRGTSTAAPPGALLAAAEIMRHASLDDGSASTAALGAAYAVVGDWDRAVETLEAAVQREPRHAAYLNDLAALYLARAADQDRAEDVPRALASAERALDATPSSKEAYFNRALALQSLYLRDAAAAAWQDYLARETDADWRSEAQRRVADLNVAIAPSWESVHARIERELSRDTTRAAAEAEIFAHYARAVRESVENNLLPGWAGDFLAKRSAAAAVKLSTARALAQAVARRGGDPMSAEAVAAIDRTIAQRDDRLLSRLAEAHRAYARGIDVYVQSRIHEAVAEFDVALPAFREAGSPLALWMQAYRALELRAYGKPEDGLRLLQSGELAGHRQRYGVINARVAWFEGLISGELGRPDDAAMYYRRALAAFESVAEHAYAADAKGLVADQLMYLGQTAEAWQLEMRAIDEHWRATGRHSRIAATSSTFLALAGRLPETALHFQNAVVGVVPQTWHAQRAEAYTFRARVHALLGMADGTWADLREAERALAAISDRGIRERMEAHIRSIRAEADVALATRRSPDAASGALEFFRRGGFPFETVRVLRTRARLRLASNDVGGAEADLRAAIEEFEKQRASMKDERSRVTSFEEGSLAFEDMVRLQALHRGRWDSALRYADRGRAISFRPSPVGPAAGAAANPLRSVAPDVAVLYYVSLDDRLLIFAASNRDAKWAERPIGRGELEIRMRRLRTLAGQDDMVRLRPALQELYEDLVSPVASMLRPHATIAVIPDGPLNDIPFAGIVLPSGRFLIEDHAIVRAPSLHALAGATAAWADAAGPLRRALIVAPSTTVDGNRTLPELPHARAEAASIAKRYPDSTVLTGAAATRGAFEAAISTADVVHFGGHAVANLRYPMLSRLLFTPGTGASGALTAFDLETLPLGRARVVTLAACEAGSGLAVRGEGTLSLARPWLRAGAASVIASIWEIEDTGARRLFTTLHELVAAGTHPATALRHVQAAAAHDGRTAFRDWAGLAAFGATPGVAGPQTIPAKTGEQ